MPRSEISKVLSGFHQTDNTRTNIIDVILFSLVFLNQWIATES